MTNMTIADEILLSTVRIEATLKGNTISTGTGFFWGTQVPGGFITSIVTNKHVIEGADGFALYAHIADQNDKSRPSGSHIRLNVERDKDGEMPHPDPDVDLVSLNITTLLNTATANGQDPFYRMLGREQIPTTNVWEHFDSIEEVLMVGCPRGIFDKQNNMPLVRRGVTATSVKRNFEGKHEFMIDLACFPGSSGSPVFFLNQQDFLVYRQNDGSMKAKPKFALLGVLYAGPLINNSGDIVLGQNPKVAVQSMMHLGQVIRSSRLLEIDDLIQEAVKRGKPIPSI